MIINPSFGGTSLDGVKMVSAVIPKGRIRGDVDGDGKITTADMDLIQKYLVDKVTLDDVAMWCADADADGEVSIFDSNLMMQYLKGTATIDLTDYYGNWTYVSVEGNAGYWTKEISVPNLTTEMTAIVNVSGTWDNGVFYQAEILNGAVRLYTKFLPAADAPFVILYGAGDGMAAINVNRNVTPEAIGALKHIVKDITLSLDGWRNGLRQSVEVDGILSDENAQIVQFIPNSTDATDCEDAGIRIEKQSSGSLTFIAKTKPPYDLYGRVVIDNLI